MIFVKMHFIRHYCILFRMHLNAQAPDDSWRGYLIVNIKMYKDVVFVAS